MYFHSYYFYIYLIKGYTLAYTLILVAGYNINYQSATRVFSSTNNVMDEKDVNTNSESDKGNDIAETTLDE